METAERCRLQSAQCRRLMELAQSEVEAKALRNLVRSGTLIANQIDQYSEIMQKPTRTSPRRTRCGGLRSGNKPEAEKKRPQLRGEAVEFG